MHPQRVEPAADRPIGTQVSLCRAADVACVTNRAAAYPRLVITILGLDVATLTAEIFDERNRASDLNRAPEPNTDVAALSSRVRPGWRRVRGGVCQVGNPLTQVP